MRWKVIVHFVNIGGVKWILLSTLYSVLKLQNDNWSALEKGTLYGIILKEQFCAYSYEPKVNYSSEPKDNYNSVQKILCGRVKLSDEAYNLLICGGQDTGKLSHVGAYSCEPKVNSYNSCPKQ